MTTIELGMNKEVSFIGEWESTLKDEPTWDESWPWVQALRDRIGPDGSYQVPA